MATTSSAWTWPSTSHCIGLHCQHGSIETYVKKTHTQRAGADTRKRLGNAHGIHLKVTDAIHYVLITDMEDIRKGRLQDGWIREKAVNIKAKLKIEFEEILPDA